jgi:hypothetical protein
LTSISLISNLAEHRGVSCVEQYLLKGGDELGGAAGFGVEDVSGLNAHDRLPPQWLTRDGDVPG